MTPFFANFFEALLAKVFPAFNSQRALVVEPLESRDMFTATVGLELLGLSSQNGHTNMVSQVINIIKGSGVKNPEIEFAGTLFNPTHPYANAKTVIQSVLPALPGTLTMTVVEDWYPHDTAGGVADEKAFFKNCNSTKTIDTSYLNYVRQTDSAFIVPMTQWANSNGYAGKLNFNIVPMLEDTCSSPTQYGNLVAATEGILTADGTQGVTRIRRNCEPQYAFRVPNVSLEVHGEWSGTLTLLNEHILQSGDTWTSDGDSEAYITGGDFLADEKSALADQIDTNLWDASFNGAPYAPYNESSRIVDPFASGSIITSLAKSALERL